MESPVAMKVKEGNQKALRVSVLWKDKDPQLK